MHIGAYDIRLTFERLEVKRSNSTSKSRTTLKITNHKIKI